MRRQPRVMAFCLPFALMLMLGIGLQPLASHAQDGDDPTRPRRVRPGEEGLILFGLAAELPPAPAFVRLLRINLEPGAQSPLHFHPGVELDAVESGVSSMTVEDTADLLPAGRTKPVAAPQGEEFEMERGDQILIPIGTPHGYENNQDDQNTVILGVVMVQAGVPGLTWVGGTPGPNALGGLSSVILGDGAMTQVPTGGQAAIAVERMILEPGESLPESDVPTMISLEDGRFDFTTVSGDTQVSRTSAPGPRDPAALDEEFSLAPGDAAFFPTGMAEVERPENDGQMSILRLTIYAIEASADGATPVGSPEASTEASPVAEGESDLAVIEITEREEPTPAPTAEPEDAPTEAADAPPGELAVGAVVTVTEAEVRLRDAPTVNSNIISGLDQGAEFTITEGPIEADGIVWWGVQSTADPSVVGYVAGDFIAPV